MSAAVEVLAEDFDKMVGECRALECAHLWIGILPLPLLGDSEGALASIERAEAMAIRFVMRGSRSAITTIMWSFVSMRASRC
jgi:hypothetical protein